MNHEAFTTSFVPFLIMLFTLIPTFSARMQCVSSPLLENNCVVCVNVIRFKADVPFTN